jgi:MFS family permease
MTGEESPARVTYRALLAVPEFRVVALTELLSVLGDQVARIAIALLVYRETGSGFAAAATYGCSYLTWLVSGPFSTVIGDSRPHRDVMVWCDAVRAVLVLAVALPGLPLPVVFGLVVAMSLVSPPFEAARSALLPELVDERSYVAGNALINTLAQAGQVVGFLLGGALVALVGVPAALCLDAFSFAASAVALRLVLRVRASPREGQPRQTVLRDAADGLRLVTATPRLRGLLGYAVLGAAAVIVPEGLAVPTADRLGGGAVAAGVLTAAVPAGFVLGSFLLLRVPHEQREAWLPRLVVVAALPLLLTPWASSIPGVAVLWVLAGFGATLQIIANAAFVQATPRDFRARAFGVAATSLMGVQGLLLLLGGALSDSYDPRVVVCAVAVATLGFLPLVSLLGATGQGPAPQDQGDLVRGMT